MHSLIYISTLIQYFKNEYGKFVVQLSQNTKSHTRFCIFKQKIHYYNDGYSENALRSSKYHNKNAAQM